jgi:glycosyltransferase involved in cell wall biosynthesis
MMDQPTDRPRVSKEPVSMLLPAYNQAAGLEPIAESWLRALARLERPVELIVVNDASTDDTATIAANLAVHHAELKVLTHNVRGGFGACLRTALAVAQHPLIFYTACNYPYPPADLTKLLAAIDAVDVVSGCRTEAVPAWLTRFDSIYRLVARIVAGTHPEPRPGWRGWRAWRADVRLRLMFGLRLWDPTSAYKLYRRSLLDRIPIQSNGEFVNVELLAKANFLGCMMVEAPIGRLAGGFKGVIEPDVAGAAGDARRVFRRPEFGQACPDNPTIDQQASGAA